MDVHRFMHLLKYAHVIHPVELWLFGVREVPTGDSRLLVPPRFLWCTNHMSCVCGCISVRLLEAYKDKFISFRCSFVSLQPILASRPQKSIFGFSLAEPRTFVIPKHRGQPVAKNSLALPEVAPATLPPILKRVHSRGEDIAVPIKARTWKHWCPAGKMKLFFSKEGELVKSKLNRSRLPEYYFRPY